MEPATRIQLFGTLRITIAGQLIVLNSSLLVQLIGYVALQAVAGRAVTRSRLAGTLFPDETEAHARRLLSETLYRLRRTLSDQADTILQADEDLIALSSVWIDINEFRAQAKSRNLADWRAAIELYGGDLLEDLDVEWVLGVRSDLHEQYLALLERTCTACIEAGDPAMALSYAHRWTLADPLHEEAHRTAMQLYAQLGRYAAALQQFNQLTRLLADELQADPLPETRALADSIRSELEAHQPLMARRVFVGRRQERAVLLERAEQAQTGHGGLILLEGQPGIGKTHLLEEVTDGAVWRGLNVVWGRANQLGGTVPYAPLTNALQSALAGPRVDQIRVRLSPSATQRLAWLLPHAHGDLAAPLSAETELKPDLTAALTECVRAMAALNTHVVFLDDVHWAGADFWSVMPTLLEQTADCHFVWVLCYRTDELRVNSAAWEAVRGLDRQLASLRIMLDGLTPSECAELATALGYSLPTEAAQRLYAHTRGNPLFVCEALTQDASSTTSFQSLLDTHLRSLPARARAALEAGAVLGREFTHGRWQALAGDDLFDAIPILITARFIQESERGYLLQHDLTREYIYGTISADRLRDLHRGAAEVLLREQVASAEVAWHFEEAELWPDAACQYYGAGDQAMKAYAYTTAVEHYTHALDLLHYLKQPQAARLTLLCRRQRALGILLRMTDWRVDVDEIEQLATYFGDSMALLEALEARLTIQLIDSDPHGMQDTAARALALAHESGNLSAEARIARNLGRHLTHQLGRVREALPYLQRAVDLTETLQDHALLGSTLCNLSGAQMLGGQCAQARASAAHALTTIALHPELEPLRTEALQALGASAWYLAEWETAYSTMRTVFERHLSLGKQWEAGEAAYRFIVVCAEMGQYEAARQMARLILTMLAQIGIDAQRSDVGMNFPVVLAYTHLQAGDLDAADQLLSTLDLSTDIQQATRAILDGLTVLGKLRLAQRHPETGLPLLARSIELSPPELTDIALRLLYYASGLCYADDMDAAQGSLARAEQVLAQSDAARYNVLLHYTRFEVSGHTDDLRAAHAEIQRQAALFKDDRLRADFLNEVPLHRDVERQWQSLHPPPAPLIVRLARVGVVLGKSLTESERVEVRWTVDDGAADADILRREGKVALRLHRLLRLIMEAEAQGAVPIDADLARTLGVAERTVERDLQTLKARGEHIITRKRK